MKCLITVKEPECAQSKTNSKSIVSWAWDHSGFAHQCGMVNGTPVLDLNTAQTQYLLQTPPAAVAKAWSTSTQIVGYCLLFGSLLKCLTVLVLSVCVWIWCTHMVCTWRSEDNLWKFVLSLIPPCGFQGWILLRLDCRCLPTELSWWLKCLQL